MTLDFSTLAREAAVSLTKQAKGPGFGMAAVSAATTADEPRRRRAPAIEPDPIVAPDDVRRLGEVLTPPRRRPRPRQTIRRRPAAPVKAAGLVNLPQFDLDISQPTIDAAIDASYPRTTLTDKGLWESLKGMFRGPDEEEDDKQALDLRWLAKQAAGGGAVADDVARVAGPVAQKVAPKATQALTAAAAKAAPAVAQPVAGAAGGAMKLNLGGLADEAAGAANAVRPPTPGGTFSLPAGGPKPVTPPPAAPAAPAVAPAAQQAAQAATTGMRGQTALNMAARTPGAVGSGASAYFDPNWDRNNVGYADPRRLATAAGATAAGYTGAGQRMAVGHSVGFGGDMVRGMAGAEGDAGLRYFGAMAGLGTNAPGLRQRTGNMFAPGTVGGTLGPKALMAGGMAATGVGGVQLARDVVGREITTRATQETDKAFRQAGIGDAARQRFAQITDAENAIFHGANDGYAKLKQLRPDLYEASIDPQTGQFNPELAANALRTEKLGVGMQNYGVPINPQQAAGLMDTVSQFRENPSALIDHAVKSVTPEQKTQWLAQLVRGTPVEGLLGGAGGGLLGLLSGGGGAAAGIMGVLDGVANKMLGLFGMDGSKMSGVQKVLVMLGGIGVVAGGVSALLGGKGLGAGLAVVGGLGMAAGLFGDKLGIGKEQPAAGGGGGDANPTAAAPKQQQGDQGFESALQSEVVSLLQGNGLPPDAFTSQDPAVKQLLEVKMQDPQFRQQLEQLQQAGEAGVLPPRETGNMM